MKENEKELMGLQAKYNEAAAANNQKRAQAMWDYTNYENQKKHMIEAGLNPALLYGMSGAGGSSASGAGQAAGVGNPGTQAVMMGIQAENMKANTQLQRAEAKKAEAEATKTSGVDTEKRKAEIQNLLSQGKVNEANEVYIKEQAETQKNIRGHLDSGRDLNEAEINNLGYQNNKLLREAYNIARDSEGKRKRAHGTTSKIQ